MSRASGMEGVGREKADGGGESQGGAYPNPRRSKANKSNAGGIMDHGGQSDIAYHGSGQLGDDDVEGPGNPNAPAKDD